MPGPSVHTVAPGFAVLSDPSLSGVKIGRVIFVGLVKVVAALWSHVSRSL